MASRIELFYDIVSPYSYYAFHHLLKLKKEWNTELVLRPFFLGAVMNNSGNRPPATVPAKALYMSKDLSRTAEVLGIKPLRIPEKFPSMTLKSMRALTYLSMTKKEFLEPCTDSLFDAHFLKNQDMENESVLITALQKGGLTETEATQIIKDFVNSPSVKNKLKEEVDEAISIGAFGAPTLLVYKEKTSSPEMFFGADRFHFIAHYLGKPYPLNSKL